MRRALIFLSALTLAAGCFRPLDPGLRLLNPSSGPELEISQSVSLIRNGKAMTAVAALQNSGEITRLAVLSPLGQKLFTVSWDGQETSTWRSPVMPKELPLALVLRDLQFALWPADSIRPFLRRGWKLEENGPLRTIRKGKKDVLMIQRSPVRPWEAPLTLEHKTAGYTITVAPLLEEE